MVFCIAILLDCTRFNLESRLGIEVFDRRAKIWGRTRPRLWGCGACTTERMALGIITKARHEASLIQLEMFSI
jgi:hypothetical protein